MSMKPQAIPEIPAETVRVVRAVFPKGTIYVHLRDTLGSIYQDELFADLYPDRGQPAYAPWRLALVTIFQFMENLTDRQAADAVRSRLDWKYALSRELTDPGFDHTVLSEFRTRLVAQTAEERFLEAVLDLCKERGWLKARGRQRTDSTHILAKVRALNRAECVVETLRHALNVLAVSHPIGYEARCSRTGWSAMDPVPVNIASPLEQTNVSSSWIRWAETDGTCWRRLKRTQPVTGCCLSLQLIPCSESGNKTTCLWKRVEPGLLTRTGSRRPDCSIPLTTSMRQRQRNDQPIGLDTKCISQKPVMKTCPGSLHTSPQTSGQFQIEKLFQLFTRPYNSRNCFLRSTL